MMIWISTPMISPALPKERSSARELADQDQQQEHIERPLGMLQHDREPGRALPAFFLQRERADPAHAGEGGLGQSQHDREQEECQHRREDQAVRSGHR
jgi:hypothetical protein